MELGRRAVVVFHGVARADDLGILQPGDGADEVVLDLVGQRGGDAVDVELAGVAALRLQEDLVALLLGEADHLVLDGRAVARADALDHARSTSATGRDWRG